MKNILLQGAKDSITVTELTNQDTYSLSIWFWIATVELVIITYLLLRSNKKKNELQFANLSKDKVRNAKNSNIDMDNLMNSINGSKDLYKELSRACHPDRFINTDKQKMAEDLFQEISKNRRDYEKLNALKQIAITNLNINFK
ncbi:hypothetical protein [Cellulophaga sp. L1A9]|uniref:hypothetical protein n=1 Tax=Cellulophaga sp. L1A9 TaxID=2686362 RepID=UPI00131C03C8|nr:hypothetical protein [Cellulophaga sp. L1A9]